MHTKFIGDPFSWKRMALPKVGGEKQRQSRVRVAKVRAAKGWGDMCHRSFVLMTYMVGRMGVNLYID